jgi:hypothetical protein
MMNALGSNTNRDVMTLLIQDMNLMKEKVNVFQTHCLSLEAMVIN